MNITFLDNAELRELLVNHPDTLLLDVRTPEEYSGLGHIPGARLLPLWELPGTVGSLDPGQKTVLICEHGVRSLEAASYLARCEFRQVYNLTAGMADWNGPRVFGSGQNAPESAYKRGIEQS